MLLVDLIMQIGKQVSGQMVFLKKVFLRQVSGIMEFLMELGHKRVF